MLRDYCAVVERAVGLGSALCSAGWEFSLAVDASESALRALLASLYVCGGKALILLMHRLVSERVHVQYDDVSDH